ncbi:hypothetical protein [Dyadobacter sp. CY323]|uniref:hypothetical protein n=1 Tax=Dyadobacter sp. CY323 TaxID=2907302 RepID=UPI001F45DFAD|nr:hypothetical protein [Dyadobacter sp. CY323]MCE6988654.1 hypothetical protein [Dyadobacter sp. CY323]
MNRSDLKIKILAMPDPVWDISKGTFDAENPKKAYYYDNWKYILDMKGEDLLFTIFSKHRAFNYDLDIRLVCDCETTFLISGLDSTFFGKKPDPNAITFTTELTSCHLAHVRGQMVKPLEGTEFQRQVIPPFLGLIEIHNRLSLSFNVNVI